MRPVTLIPGGGAGPEMCTAARRVIEAAGAKIDWRVVDSAEAATRRGTTFLRTACRSLEETKVALKGPACAAEFDLGELDRRLRTEFDLHATIYPCRALEGVRAAEPDFDVIVVQDTTVERPVVAETESAAVDLRRADAKRVAHAAFTVAAMQARRRVTVVGAGPFTEAALETAGDYAQLESGAASYEETAREPGRFDVLLCDALAGERLSDLCVERAGGPEVVASMRLGEGVAVFEPVLGSAPGRDAAEPVAMLLAAALLLERLNEHQACDRIRRALGRVLSEGKALTPALGGSAKALELVDAVVAAIRPR
jgi:isocitrate dehydrogenase (NAD+)